MNNTLVSNHNTQESQEIVAIPYKVLQSLLAKKMSGRLTIQDPNDLSVQWRIYLGDGKILFASSLMGQRERLSYLLGIYLPDSKFYIPQDLESDYKYICQQWQNNHLDLQQTRNILGEITQEALTLCLALPRASLSFEKVIGLDPILLSLNVKSLVVPVKDEIRQWVHLRAEISSPFVRPYIKDLGKFKSKINSNKESQKILEQLQDYFQDHCTLYKIASHTQQKTLNLALFLQPMIKSEILGVLPYQSLEIQERPLVACIDDSQAIQRIVKMTLKAGGFEVMSITEPAKAMSQFVRRKPALILMDINMPEIDGYKLAYMLRQSALLKDIPIMMLTGRDGVLDRVKAKMVGAIGYICKPFNPQELVQLVQENIQQ
jgi:twitching motility two-component system response regulator PilG